jgi:hypothetical protein
VRQANKYRTLDFCLKWFGVGLRPAPDAPAIPLGRFPVHVDGEQRQMTADETKAIDALILEKRYGWFGKLLNKAQGFALKR